VEIVFVILVLLAVVAAFTVSAAAGFGGSLILVPALGMLLGTKSGVALAALLLAANNVVKVGAYRRSLPFAKAGPLVVIMALGAALGARLLVTASERVVTVAVLVAFVTSFVVERFDVSHLRRVSAPLLALGSGATSGFAGTSGPLKGIAIRSLQLDRAHLVGALSLASLAGDASKAVVWTQSGLLTGQSYLLALAVLPLMFAATLGGRELNQFIGERGFRHLFWAVMVGYAGRLILWV
jgi:uncharacterized protein